MLEIFGRALINLIEKELAEAAPEVAKVILAQIESLVNQLVCYLTGKGCSIAALSAPVEEAKPVEDKNQE